MRRARPPLYLPRCDVPLYEYHCGECNTVTEDIAKVDERKEAMPCDLCGEMAYFKVSMCARTAGRWGDSGGAFDVDLGCHINNSQHRERVMADKGMIHASDIGGARNLDAVNARTKGEQTAARDAKIKTRCDEIVRTARQIQAAG